jgi:hypothetical protein
LEIDKDTSIEEIDLLEVRDKNSLVKTLKKLERLIKKGIPFNDEQKTEFYLNNYLR